MSLWSAVDSSLVVENPANKTGFVSSNAYLCKSGGKCAADVAEPLSYGLVLMIAMMVAPQYRGILDQNASMRRLGRALGFIETEHPEDRASSRVRLAAGTPTPAGSERPEEASCPG